MWKRRRTWILLVALIGVALAVYFEPTHCVRGWLWGEAFYDGRPTSYWRAVVERDLQSEPEIILIRPGTVPPANWFDRCKTWIGWRPSVECSHNLVYNFHADDVLRELSQCEKEDVANWASDILNWGHREWAINSPDDWPYGNRQHFWQQSICKRGCKWKDKEHLLIYERPNLPDE